MSNIILININTDDRNGLHSDFYSIIESLDARILDIHQSVIHKQTSQAMVLQLDNSNEEKSVIKRLKDSANTLKLNIKIDSVSEGDYQKWHHQTDNEKYALTLLTQEISAKEIARVTQTVCEQGFQIYRIHRLSNKIPLDETTSHKIQSCIEFSLSGSPKKPDTVRAELLKISSELGVDLALQKDDAYRRSRRLICFDMDSTLINAEVIDLLAKYAGVEAQVAQITEQAMQGKLDFKQSFIKRMALLKGLDIEVLPKIAAELELMEGASCLIKNLKNHGFKTAILSGGFNYFAEHLKKLLGIDYVFANGLVSKNGKLTGETVEPIVDAKRKADLLMSLASQEGISPEHTIAVGDGANDLPMLSCAGFGIAFRAKPLVRETAKQSISTHGLDSILYLLGFTDSDIER